VNYRFICLFFIILPLSARFPGQLLKRTLVTLPPQSIRPLASITQTLREFKKRKDQQIKDAKSKAEIEAAQTLFKNSVTMYHNQLMSGLSFKYQIAVANVKQQVGEQHEAMQHLDDYPDHIEGLFNNVQASWLQIEATKYEKKIECLHSFFEPYLTEIKKEQL
jgi:hypothetical protein